MELFESTACSAPAAICATHHGPPRSWPYWHSHRLLELKRPLGTIPPPRLPSRCSPSTVTVRTAAPHASTATSRTLPANSLLTAARRMGNVYALLALVERTALSPYVARCPTEATELPEVGIRLVSVKMAGKASTAMYAPPIKRVTL